VEQRLLPAALNGVNLGPEVLELGPGLGVTTRLLAARVPRLTAVEVEAGFAVRLHRELGHSVRILHADASQLPLADRSYSGVVCFTMLHHVPSPRLQDRLFAEAYRVLRPGGVFAGSDSQPSPRFRLIHLFDTMVVVDPATLGARLAAAGFTGVRVSADPRRVRFVAHRR
jgi:ubiquinone/menaquinone biosynthesis C-methylase UbiE